jgi:integrase
VAFVRKRETDQARGRSGKYTCYFVGDDGKRHSRAGTTDRAESLKLATHLEAEATRIRTGELDDGERKRREASLAPVADHLADYREELEAKGDTSKHVSRTVRALTRLLDLAKVASVADLAPDRIRGSLGRLADARTSKPASARTRNFHLQALKAFATWLHHCGRIEEFPRGLAAIKPGNEREDRRKVRRALTRDELARLLVAAEQGDPIEAGRGPRKATLAAKGPPRMITGPERAALYRLAAGTGFRADELRTLTPERFHLEGEQPTITVLACYSKNGKEAVQPITRGLAARLRPFLEGKAPGSPVLHVPVRTAQMLRADLKAAGIDPFDSAGREVDFHALRSSYITHLILDGVNPKVVQMLARHSTITLTLDRYTTVDNQDLRKALEGEES